MEIAIPAGTPLRAEYDGEVVDVTKEKEEKVRILATRGNCALVALRVGRRWVGQPRKGE